MVDSRKNLEQWGPIDAVILYMSFWYKPSGPGMRRGESAGWPEYIGFFSKRRVTFWWEKDLMQEKGEIAIKKWLLSEKKLKALKFKYKQILKRWESLREEIESSLPKEKKEIDKLVFSLYDFITNFWAVCLPFELANFAVPGFLEKKLIGKVPKEKIPETLEILLAPKYLSYHQQEELDLLRNFLRDKNDLKQHMRKWFWVENNYLECKNLSEQYFKNRLKNISRTQVRNKIKNIEKYSSEVLINKKNLIGKYKLPKSVFKLSEIFSFSIWWQDERKGKIWQYNSWVEKLAKQTEKIFHIPFKDLLLYNAEEWVRLHKKGIKLSQNQLKDRAKNTVLNVSSKEYRIRSDVKSINSVRPFLLKNKKNNTSTSTFPLKGIVVSRGSGIVAGKVKILQSPRDGLKMKAGDILVAPMTTPDFVPYMRLAKAIITDVGGLMSHAAVVSREMKKACIVNTKFATQVLKDGDLVEVDANKGIVRKI